jgi:glutamate racemase
MIGVFDSGVGGLSIHRALTRRLPQADFVYLADQAHAPYGGRGGEEIVQLTRLGCARLFEAGATLAILACNTASAIALRRLQQQWLPGWRRETGRAANVLGIIVPTIEAATGRDWADAAPAPGPAPMTVAVFATEATVRSRVYDIEIGKRRPDICVASEACPALARLIETDAPRAALAATVEAHVGALLDRLGAAPERAILGCTHYEIVADLFRAALPPETALIHQPDATAEALARYLARHPEHAPGSGGARLFLTSGAGGGHGLAEAFWGAPLDFAPLGPRGLPRRARSG